MKEPKADWSNFEEYKKWETEYNEYIVSREKIETFKEDMCLKDLTNLKLKNLVGELDNKNKS